MAVSDEQYQNVLARVTALENHGNDMAVAVDNFVTMSQVTQLLTIFQTALADLTTRVEALENRITAIENEPLS